MRGIAYKEGSRLKQMKMHRIRNISGRVLIFQLVLVMLLWTSACGSEQVPSRPPNHILPILSWQTVLTLTPVDSEGSSWKNNELLISSESMFDKINICTKLKHILTKLTDAGKIAFYFCKVQLPQLLTKI